MAASVAAAALLRRLHVPPVVGFIIAGILIGPGGLGLVSDRHQIELVAEVGVMLLLFTVGLKLRLSTLWQMRIDVLGGGTLQVLLCGGAASGAALLFGRPPAEAAVWGALAALSSTALVLWLLEGTGETGTAHGRTMVAILLFQDLAVVPIMLALPLLTGHATSALGVVWLLGRALAVVVLTMVGAQVLFPWVTARIVATGSRELFTLTTVLAAVGTALLFGYFGLSMALGAFLAGMVVSESEYVGRMIEGITPLRDVFNSLFFVSIGMLVQPRLWFEQPLLTIGLLVGVVAVKTLLTGAVALPLLRNPIAALTVGLGLAQVGELSIVVAVEASRLDLLAPAESDLFLAVMVPTLVATPYLMRLGSRLSRRSKIGVTAPKPVALSNHVVIVGYGINGRNVARALRLLDMPHLVIDLNPYSVAELLSSGTHALEGDARHSEVLVAAGFDRARGLVAAIADAASTREIVRTAQALNPEAVIFARTRFLREVGPLTALGADEVIPEEFETSLELAGRVLALYGAPPYLVEQEKAALRDEGYGLLRTGDEAPHPKLATLCRLPGLVRLVVEAESAAAGRTLRELDLRSTTRASVVAIERGRDLVSNPKADYRLKPGDVLISLADGDAFAALQELLTGEASGVRSVPVGLPPRHLAREVPEQGEE